MQQQDEIESKKMSEGKKIFAILDVRVTDWIIWKTAKLGMSIFSYIGAGAGVGGVTSLKIAAWRGSGETPNQLRGSGVCCCLIFL